MAAFNKRFWWIAAALAVACTTVHVHRYLVVDDGLTGGEAVSKVVKRDEEATLTLRNGASVYVPKGAVMDRLTVGLERPKDERAARLIEPLEKSERRLASAPHILTPHGAKFDAEVTVTLPIAKESRDGPVEVHYLDDEDDREWKLVAQARGDGETATIRLAHFSVVVLVESEESAQDDASVMATPSDASVDAAEMDASAPVDASPTDGALVVADAGDAELVEPEGGSSGCAEIGVPTQRVGPCLYRTQNQTVTDWSRARVQVGTRQLLRNTTDGYTLSAEPCEDAGVDPSCMSTLRLNGLACSQESAGLTIALTCDVVDP